MSIHLNDSRHLVIDNMGDILQQQYMNRIKQLLCIAVNTTNDSTSEIVHFEELKTKEIDTNQLKMLTKIYCPKEKLKTCSVFGDLLEYQYNDRQHPWQPDS